jgi:hypothetical protein
MARVSSAVVSGMTGASALGPLPLVFLADDSVFPPNDTLLAWGVRGRKRERQREREGEGE